jgi:hypothetical protein
MNDNVNINLLKEAWEQASVDLGIDVTFDIEIFDGDNNICFPILIKSFGSNKGTLVLSGRDIKEESIAKKYGFYFSCLFQSYQEYSRQLFIDTLNDWGWFGAENDMPEWYCNKPWC